jgi:hypothetical protein
LLLQVKTNRPLDREKQDLYLMAIVAKDGGTPSLSSTTTVTIHLEDVNDNVPFFVFPSNVRFPFVLSTVMNHVLPNTSAGPLLSMCKRCRGKNAKEQNIIIFPQGPTPCRSQSRKVRKR